MTPREKELISIIVKNPKLGNSSVSSPVRK